MSPPSTNSLQQLENAPALRPPPGVQPNYVNPPSYESKILALECVFLPLMLIAVGVRIFVRSRMTKIWGWDDCKDTIPPNGTYKPRADEA